MFTAHATTNATWRYVLAGAPVNGSVARPMATCAVDPTSFTKHVIARPTRRGAPPH